MAEQLVRSLPRSVKSLRGTRREHAAVRPTESSPAEIHRYPQGAL
jgi:hypothetical protein